MIGLNLNKGCILITIHPETNSSISVENFMKPIIFALEKFKELPLVITYSNSDPGGFHINSLLEKFCKKNFQNFFLKVEIFSRAAKESFANKKNIF